MPRLRAHLVPPILLSATIGLAVASAGCGSGPCTRFDGCPSVDQAAGPADDVVDLNDAGLVTVAAGTTVSTLGLEGGEVIFAPQVRGCVPIADAPCHATLHRLSLRIASFDVTTADGHTAAVSDVVVSLVAPLEVQDSGSGYLVPAGAVYQTCAIVDGHPQSESAASPVAGGILGVGEATQDLSFDGAFVMALHNNDGDCTELQIAASAMVGGAKPWTQVAP